MKPYDTLGVPYGKRPITIVTQLKPFELYIPELDETMRVDYNTLMSMGSLTLSRNELKPTDIRNVSMFYGYQGHWPFNPPLQLKPVDVSEYMDHGNGD